MKRPTHPDFKGVCKIVCDLDDESEDQNTFEEMVGAEIDPHTLAYLADQRALRVLMISAATGSDALAGAGSAWIDGFMTGARWAKRAERGSSV